MHCSVRGTTIEGPMRHMFLVVGLAVVAYFFVIDFDSLKPTALHYALVCVGFVSILIYVVHSFVLFRKSRKSD